MPAGVVMTGTDLSIMTQLGKDGSWSISPMERAVFPVGAQAVRETAAMTTLQIKRSKGSLMWQLALSPLAGSRILRRFFMASFLFFCGLWGHFLIAILKIILENIGHAIGS